jgi:hypothetical protein
MTPTEQQLQELAEHYPGATSAKGADGSYLITVPNVPLPQGWNAQTTTVRFVAPVGYPISKPDCFWADANLKLTGGRNPQNTNQNPLPNGPNPLLWFSWHAERWSPNNDSLLTYFRVIKKRFLELR